MATTLVKAWMRALVAMALIAVAWRVELGNAQQPAKGGKLTVTNPLVTDTTITHSYIGKIAAQDHIAISPQASGYLQEIAVKEGQAVKKGDVLFKILPTIYQAKLDVELAEVKIAQIEFDNTNDLFNRKVVSAHELALAKAKLDKAQAKAKVAETELSFTTVRAAFDGMIGRISVQPGSLAKIGETLTTLTDNSTVRAYFNVADVHYLEAAATQEQDKENVRVELALASGKKLGSIGAMTPIESNSQAGTIVFRADFPNPTRLLLHGQSATVHVHQPLHDALLIPQQSTIEVNGKVLVGLVGDDGIVRGKEITIQRETDDCFVIKGGLERNDRILFNGVGKLRFGEKVDVEFRKPEEVILRQKIPLE